MDRDLPVVDVECYAGFRGDEVPRRFSIGPRHVEVTEVLDRWMSTEHRYFRVRGDDGRVYLLRQDSALGHWELTRLKGGGGPDILPPSV